MLCMAGSSWDLYQAYVQQLPTLPFRLPLLACMSASRRSAGLNCMPRACARLGSRSSTSWPSQLALSLSLSFPPSLSISLSLRLALVHVCGFSAAGATFSDRQSVKWVMQKRKRSRRGWLPYMHTQFWACTERNDQSICCAKYSSFNYFSLSIKSIKSSKFAYILWEKSLKTIDSKWKSVALSNHQYYRLFYFIMLYKSFNGARLASRIPF